MEFVCGGCGCLNKEVEPWFSEEQNKKYLNLEKRIEKFESELKKINKDCTEELERRKAKRKKFSIPCMAIGLGMYILGGVLLGWIPNISFVLVMGLMFGGIGVLAVGYWYAFGHINFERIFKKKYPEMAESKDFRIPKYSKEIELSRESIEYFIELKQIELKQKWNCSFTCRFCGQQNRFWKKS